MKTVIIGAGITGLSTAYHLKKNYVIFEKEDIAGGLCRSIKKDGFIFDYTGHFLHLHTDYGKKFISKLMDDNLIKIERNAYIYSNNVFTKYPFQINLYGLPKKIIKECIVDYIISYFCHKNNNSEFISFKEWIINNFGYGLYKHFFLPYNRKLFLIPLNRLNANCMKQFIPKPNPDNQLEILLGAVTDYQKKFGYNAHFFYPRVGGIGSLINELQKKVNNLYLNSRIDKINFKKKYIVVNNKKIRYNYLISTIPLNELLLIIEDLPDKLHKFINKFDWNSIYCINIGIKRKNILKNKHWIYFPEKKFIFYRVGIYSNICKTLVPYNNSSIYVEVSTRKNKIFNTNRIIENVIKDLIKCKILMDSSDIEIINILNIPYGYVIHYIDTNSILKSIMEFLNKNNIYSIGRYGAWKYSYMEESILDGKAIAEKIQNG